MTEDGQYQGKEYTLTGAWALSYQEAVEIIAQASGREIKYVAISNDDMRNALKSQGWQPEQVEFMLELFSAVRQGWTADVSPDVSSILGREPISFEQFARDKAKAWK